MKPKHKAGFAANPAATAPEAGMEKTIKATKLNHLIEIMRLGSIPQRHAFAALVGAAFKAALGDGNAVQPAPEREQFYLMAH